LQAPSVNDRWPDFVNYQQQGAMFPLVDRHFEELLRSVIGSDPTAIWTTKSEKPSFTPRWGMLSAEKLRAIWEFAGSISDESIRSQLLHKIARRLALAFNFKMSPTPKVARAAPRSRLSGNSRIV
jgi:hypothetical protein